MKEWLSSIREVWVQSLPPSCFSCGEPIADNDRLRGGERDSLQKDTSIRLLTIC